MPGNAQLVYSTFLSGAYEVTALAVEGSDVVTIAGYTESANFPTTRNAFDTTYNGRGDVFVSRLDPRQSGAAQLVYSTVLGGKGYDHATALAVDSRGVATITGAADRDFPTTRGAYETTGGGVFVSRLDPSQSGAAQLVYSTFVGRGRAKAIAVDLFGVVTLAGGTTSTAFPTTKGAYDTVLNSTNCSGSPCEDIFVSRVDPIRSGKAQLVYSTFLGGGGIVSRNSVSALFVDAGGIVTVAGSTDSPSFPTTRGAYDTTHNGPTTGSFRYDAFISRLDMGVAMHGDVHEIPIRTGGSQRLTVNAGKAHAHRPYWIFGSATGAAPGVNLLGVHIPLNPDAYTDLAMASANTAALTNFRGTLDASGRASASVNVPANLPVRSGLQFHHAYVVYSAGGLHMASNAVPLRLY